MYVLQNATIYMLNVSCFHPESWVVFRANEDLYNKITYISNNFFFRRKYFELFLKSQRKLRFARDRYSFLSFFPIFIVQIFTEWPFDKQLLSRHTCRRLANSIPTDFLYFHLFIAWAWADCNVEHRTFIEKKKKLIQDDPHYRHRNVVQTCFIIIIDVNDGSRSIIGELCF